ncbi:MAG: outer membrane lipid asymmetry maintenance protein MlaD [Acidiferrobacteraceae bacterium]|jgi:phospholipid/cholesterol/gamma-HCH transport system substrate-binding protein
MVQKRTVELWVGIFVAGGLLAVAMLAFRVGNLGSADVSNPYVVTAKFQNIGGLKVKAAVTMAGVRIGRVTNIGFDPRNYEAIVSMSIDGKYKNIPDDASASILTSGLLGEQYIGIVPGGSDQYLKNGSQITLTQSALVLENLIGQVMVKLTEGSGTEKK